MDELTRGREQAVVEAVRGAYLGHGRGRSCLPHSTFLRFPDHPSNRIIALPAYLGDGFELAGMKWIASFPDNVRQGVPRASAVLVLNSCATGLPTAILEGSLISAQRTAASAALAARELVPEPPRSVGLIGAGVISQETARFLRALLPEIEGFLVFDLDASRAAECCRRLVQRLGVEARVAPDLPTVLAECPLSCFATTATEPHVESLAACPPGATVLHVSLRDLSPAAILASDNVVDDPDHVSRAGTSIELAERARGDRGFIRATLAEVLEGRVPARRETGGVTVFSPFGLGVLDLAVGKLVADEARRAGVGRILDDFLPVAAAEVAR